MCGRISKETTLWCELGKGLHQWEKGLAMIEVWTLPRNKRKHILRLCKKAEQELDAAIDEVIRCQNALNNAIFQREAFRKQLTLLDNQFKFDPQ